MSDFELKNLKRVRFNNKYSKTCRNLKQKFYKLSEFGLRFLELVEFCEDYFIFEASPKSTTYIFHNVFLQITMYSFSQQCLRQLDNKIRHLSNNTSCTRFRKEVHPRFCYGLSLFSLDKLDICRNKLLQVRLGKQALGQF